MRIFLATAIVLSAAICSHATLARSATVLAYAPCSWKATNINEMQGDQARLSALAEQAREAWYAGNTATAEKTWRYAMSFIESRCYPIALAHADSLLIQGKARSAFAEYDDYFTRQNTIQPCYNEFNVSPPLDAGFQSAEAGDLSRARTDFNLAASRVPNHPCGGFPTAHFMLGAVAYASGSREEARSQWRIALLQTGPATPDPGPVPEWPSALRFYLGTDG